MADGGAQVSFATVTLILLAALWIGLIALHIDHRFVRNLEDNKPREHATDD